METPSRAYCKKCSQSRSRQRLGPVPAVARPDRSGPFMSTGAPASFSAAHTVTTSSRRSSRVIRGSGSTPPASALWKSPSSADGKVVEKRGGNGPQRVRAFQAPKRLNKPNLFPTGCHRLPSESHGKDGVDGSSPSEGFSEAPPPRRAVRHGSRLG